MRVHIDEDGDVAMLEAPSEAPKVTDLAPNMPDPMVVDRLDRVHSKFGPGDPKAHMPNTVMVLSYDRRQQGRIRRDVMRDRITIDGREWVDEDAHELRMWLLGVYGFLPNAAAMEEAVALVARENSYNPLGDWLRSLEWDGTSRVESMLRDCFGCTDEPLTRALSTKFMVSAVARALRPACQVDTVLIVQGPQGARKTSGFRALAGAEWFAAPVIDVRKKDAAMALRSCWILEWAELDNLKRSEATAVKAFITERSDTYRPPYGRTVRTYPRTCVFVGTTNDEQFLNDSTGDRRYWVVSSPSISVERIVATRSQLWAEAIALLDSGATWWLTDEEEAWREAANARFRDVDPWVQLTADWLDGREECTVEQLLTDQGERTSYGGMLRPPGLGIPAGQLQPYHANRAAKILRQLGWGPSSRKASVSNSPTGSRKVLWVRCP
jgi:predicted P-loop ATPase